jgi:hypothetical protein
VDVLEKFGTMGALTSDSTSEAVFASMAEALAGSKSPALTPSASAEGGGFDPPLESLDEQFAIKVRLVTMTAERRIMNEPLWLM